MRKLFTIFLAALTFGTAYAQNTISKSAEIELRPSANMLMAYSNIGERTWVNEIGKLTLFSAFNGSLDSVKSQAWEVTVKSVRANSPGTVAIVDVRGTLLRNPSRFVSYEDTINAAAMSNGYLPLPKTGKLDNLFAHDSTFALYFDITNTPKAGDKTVIKFDRYVPLFADSTGKMFIRVKPDVRDSLLP